MRRVAIILILTFVLATPALAASQEASQEQAAAWDKVVLDYYDGKYGASEEYDQDYVNISDWVIVDVDSSELEAQAREEMAVKEQELAEVERQVGELQERYDYFHSLMQSVEDEDYKKELESLVQDAEKALNDAQKEAESMQSEIQGLQEEEYLTQIAVAKAEIKFGGNVLGTMTSARICLSIRKPVKCWTQRQRKSTQKLTNILVSSRKWTNKRITTKRSVCSFSS